MAYVDQARIEAAIRSGALIRYRVHLDEGEWDQRVLWLRPEVNDLVNSEQLDTKQRERMKAALKRFLVGGPFTVVTANCPHHEVANLGDIRELKGAPPPFVELRFKPPKHDLRIFGRFIRKDGLMLTSYGMKSLDRKTGEKSLSIPHERQRCDTFFRGHSFELDWVPNQIEDSLSNATFA